MLEYKLADGSIFLLGNLFTLVATVGALYYICYKIPTQIDKAEHASLSAAIVIVSLVILTLAGVKSYWWVAPLIGLAAGFGKEIWDKLNPKKKLFDWKDILADVIGVSWITVVYFMSFYK